MSKKELGVIVLGVIVLVAVGYLAGWLAAVVVLALGYLLLKYLKIRNMMLGNRSYNCGDLNAAVASYRRAARLPFTDERTVLTFVQLLIRAGALDEAERELSALSGKKMRKNEDKLLYTLLSAQYTWKRGDLQKAAAMVEEAHKAGIRNSASYATLGTFYLMMKDYEKALSINEEAYEYDDTNTSILDNLGETYLALDRLEDAQKIYDKLMEEEPGFPEAFYHKGELLERLGNTEEAVSAYKEALRKPFSEVSVITEQVIQEKIRQIEEQHS